MSACPKQDYSQVISDESSANEQKLTKTQHFGHKVESDQSGTMSRPQDFLDYLYRKAISDGLLCTIIVY